LNLYCEPFYYPPRTGSKLFIGLVIRLVTFEVDRSS
jgi:hypothetical protein